MAAGPPVGGGAAGPLGPPPVANQWNASSLAVAVWEWQDEHGKWRPYSSKVSTYIEQCMQSFQQQKNARALGNSNSISLGQVDPKLAPYIIDIATLAQFRQDTGTMRYVRKTLCSIDSAPAKGVCWEWMNDDGSWTAYETQICIYLEEKFSNGNTSVDLGVFGLRYYIDFGSCIQTNQATGFRRQIQRRCGTPYPTTPKAGPVHKSAACACHQCLASSGAGPMHRYRHSMINLPTSSNYQSSSRISGNSVGYLPYPKPSMTSAKSAPKLNSTWIPQSMPVQLSGPSSANGVSIPSAPVHTQKGSSVNRALAGMTAILMSAAGLPVRLTSALPPSNPHGASKRDKNSVRKLRKMPKKGATDPEQVVKKYLENLDKPAAEDCIICMDSLTAPCGYSETSQCKSIKPTAVGKLKKCGHVFHQLCMFEMYNSGNKDGSLQCPSCKTIYGEKTGTQPKGKMEIFLIPQSLPGHQDCGTIHIVYTISPGTQDFS
ncbi:probable E3 ubiquitin-protein ligase DTX2 [Hyperolius riggenbachi]|uniref:probable E3 ubiquitin-protein ligase DTX2 n=1 Tax=Hyperolius riggenbachi TaxID=752182 RepID=UPI0035A29F4D